MLRILSIRFLCLMIGAGPAWVIAQDKPPQPPAVAAPPAVVVAEQIFPALVPMIRSAAQQSLRTVSANIEALIAEETRKVAHARLLPSIWGSSTWLLAQDRRLGQSDPLPAEKLDYVFQVRQPIYHWGALKAAENLSKIGIKIAENNAVEAYRLLVLEVRRTYLQIILQKASLNRTRFAFRQTEERQKLAKASLESGRLAPAEIAAINFGVEQSRLDLEIKEEDYRTARYTLERLTGISPIADEDIPTLIPQVPHSAVGVKALVNHFVGTDAVKETVAVANAQMRLDQEKLNYRITSTNLRPKFNVVTGASQSEVSYTGSQADRQRIQTISAGVGFDWTIFDGFTTRAQLRTSKLRMRQIEAERDEKTRFQLESVQSQSKQLDFSARQTDVRERMLSDSEAILGATEESVKRGTATVRHVEAATLNRDDALIAAMAARADYLGRLSDFLSTIGRDPALQSFTPSPRP